MPTCTHLKLSFVKLVLKTQPWSDVFPLGLFVRTSKKHLYRYSERKNKSLDYP